MRRIAFSEEFEQRRAVLVGEYEFLRDIESVFENETAFENDHVLSVRITSTRSIAVEFTINGDDRLVVLRDLVVIDAPDWPGFGLCLLDDA